MPCATSNTLIERQKKIIFLYYTDRYLYRMDDNMNARLVQISSQKDKELENLKKILLQNVGIDFSYVKNRLAALKLETNELANQERNALNSAIAELDGEPSEHYSELIADYASMYEIDSQQLSTYVYCKAKHLPTDIKLENIIDPNDLDILKKALTSGSTQESSVSIQAELEKNIKAATVKMQKDKPAISETQVKDYFKHLLGAKHNLTKDILDIFKNHPIHQILEQYKSLYEKKILNLHREVFLGDLGMSLQNNFIIDAIFSEIANKISELEKFITLKEQLTALHKKIISMGSAHLIKPQTDKPIKLGYYVQLNQLRKKINTMQTSSSLTMDEINKITLELQQIEQGKSPSPEAHASSYHLMSASLINADRNQPTQQKDVSILTTTEPIAKTPVEVFLIDAINLVQSEITQLIKTAANPPLLSSYSKQDWIDTKSDLEKLQISLIQLEPNNQLTNNLIIEALLKKKIETYLQYRGQYNNHPTIKSLEKVMTVLADRNPEYFKSDHAPYKDNNESINFLRYADNCDQKYLTTLLKECIHTVFSKNNPTDLVIVMKMVERMGPLAKNIWTDEMRNFINAVARTANAKFDEFKKFSKLPGNMKFSEKNADDKEELIKNFMDAAAVYLQSKAASSSFRL